MELFWWFALPVAAGTFYGCYFWNQRHAQPDWLRLPTRADYLHQHPECATDDEHGARCCLRLRQGAGPPQTGWPDHRFRHTCLACGKALFRTEEPLYKVSTFALLYGDVWRWQMLTPAKQQKSTRSGQGDISDGKGLTALEAQVAQKKHLQALRAVKRRGTRKGTMLAFVGILCACPLANTDWAVYLVGMRYYHGYLGQFFG